MAIISNFELLLKPIAPPGGPAAEVARVAVQGYFLEISNLESRDITLIFRTRTSVKQPADAANTEFVAGNNAVAYDITQDNLIDTVMTSAGELIAGKQLGHFVNSLSLPAGQTASLAILPNVQALLPSPGDPAPDLAIRGYTELVLSSPITSFNPITFGTPRPARILVSAEHRSTYIDPDFDPASFANQTDLDFDQTAYSLPLANGQAEQFIDTHANFNDVFTDLMTSNFGGLIEVPWSSLSKNLPADANLNDRLAEVTVAGTPVRFGYGIKAGNYFVDPKSTIQALRVLRRAKVVSKEVIENAEKVVETINAALSGDKDADAKLAEIFGPQA